MAAWANLSSMRLFSIMNNSMTGTLPNELATAWPKLATLVLSNNRLAGKLPADVAQTLRGSGRAEASLGERAHRKQLEFYAQAPYQVRGPHCHCLLST